MEIIHGRRKLKRGYEYEVQWKGQPLDKNEWLTRDILEEMGFQKMLNDIDIKEAAKMGLVQRPLTGQLQEFILQVSKHGSLYVGS